MTIEKLGLLDNGKDYVDKAELKCRCLFFWLYLAGKDDDHIKSIPIQICSDSNIANHFESRIFQ